MKCVKLVGMALLVVMMVVLLAVPALAADSTAAVSAGEEEIQTADTSASSAGLKAIAAGVAIGLAAAGGAVGMGIVGGKAADGISRQPEMESKIRTTLMLDLVFIETAIIYALLVVILVIFVL